VLKSRVDEMLSNYLEHRARCEHLGLEIQEAERTLALMQSEQVEDMISITSRLTGMPGTQEGMSEPTARVATLIADGHKTEHIEKAEEELTKLKKELAEKLPTVVFVNAWITALDTRERYIMENKVLGGLSWKQLVYTFNKQFGDSYSQQGLRKIKDAAMDKIYRIAE